MKSVSVVIPNYKKEPLINHLPQVIKACPQAEIIVVDDASPDDTVSYLSKHFPGVKVIANGTNQRFAASCNIGFAAASGDIVVLLNSDVAPKPNFLKPLIRHFSANGRSASGRGEVFGVGCLEINAVNGKRQISGKNGCQFKRGFLIHWAAKVLSQTKPTKNCWVSGGSGAFDRQKYLDLGGMDVIYKPAYWEDIDLSYRAREKHGWKVLFEPRSQVFHNHETTNVSVFGQRKMQAMASRNQFLFVWKNIRGRQLLEHWLWLPYHLLFTTVRTQGVFLIAFFQATTHWFKFRKDSPFGKNARQKRH